MALVLANRVQETATANTTVSFTLTGAIQGFQTFAVVGDTNTTYYSATDASGNWEVGLGTYSTTGPTLTRTTVYASSNSGLAVTFSGAVNVFLTYPSGRSVNLDASGNVSALGTVASGTWQGSTVGVAYGGTGVTTSSGANSVVLRDSNQNITVNRISQGTQAVTAAGGTTILTAASQFNQTLTGTGGQTYRLPDATTLTDTTTFQFNNNATGTLTITDYASATIGTVAPGGAAGIALLNNATTGGTWDVHAYIPENVTWGTNSLALGSTVITGGTWNGGTISSAYGGTGLTTFAGANNALYSTSASALAAGTLPVAAGGTGATTLTGYVYGNGTGAFTASTSIPNSATTATSANTASAIVARDASGNFSAGTITATLSGNATTLTSQDIRTLSPSSTTAYRLTFGFTSWANNNSAPYADYLALRSYSDSSGGADNLVMFNKSTIAMRVWQQSFGSATAYSSYADVLMSNNYSGYSTFSGTVSATGGRLVLRDDSIENHATASDSAGVAVNYYGYAAGTSYFRNFTVYDGKGSPRLYVYGSANYTQATGSSRAPLFYDSDNTGYYVDPASGSNLNGTLTNNGGASMTGGWNRNLYLASTFPVIVFGSNGTKFSGIGVDYSVAASGFYFWVNGSSADISGTGTVALSINTNNYVEAYGSSRAPIFYDSNDTGYYVNPNSDSQFSSVYANNWFRPQGDTGLYFQSYGYGLWAPQAGSNSYGNVTTYAVGRNGWTGYGLGSRITLMTDTNNGGTTTGLHDSNVGWYWRYVYDSYFTVDRGYSTFANSARAPIFYDSDNTGYYVDPNSTSYVYYLQSATSVRSDSDKRVKDNIEPIRNALEKVKQLAGCTYTRTDLEDKTKRHMGMLAQDVLPIVPEVVGGSEETRYSIAYGEMSALLVEAIKEIDERLTALEARVNKE